MRGVRQTLAAFTAGVASALIRPRHVLLALVGFFIATAVLIALLAIPRSIGRAAVATGSKDVILLMPRKSGPAGPALAARDVAIAADLPGVARAVPELIVTRKLRRSDGTQTQVLVRGLTPGGFALARPRLKLLAGHRFKPGTNEVIVGREAARAFPQLRLGAQIRFAKNIWRVAGVFGAGGSLWESEIWVPLATLQSAINAPGRISAVLVKLAAPGDFARFKRAVKAEPRLHVRLKRERAYYQQQMGFLVYFARIGAWGVALLLGLAALAAIANAVALGLLARAGELAVLRMLGFSRTSLALALIGEVLLTGLVGAGLAALVAWLFVGGSSIVTTAGAHAVVLRLSVGPALIGTAIGYALLIGLASALVPCLRAVSKRLATTLRES